jgi:hypothetical protein
MNQQTRQQTARESRPVVRIEPTRQTAQARDTARGVANLIAAMKRRGAK